MFWHVEMVQKRNKGNLMMKVSVTLHTAEIKIGVEKNNIDIINYV